MAVYLKVSETEKERLTIKSPKCIFTLSPNKSYTNTGKLKEIIISLFDVFSNVLIVNGYYNNRWNLFINKQLDERKFEQLYIKEIDKFNKRVFSISTELGIEERISAIDWKKTLIELDYQLVYSNIREYYSTSEQFSNDLKSIAENYLLHNNKKSNLKLNYITLSINYLIEEISMIIFLYNKGYEIEVYPGEDLSLFNNIIEKIYPDFPYDLHNRKHYTIIIA